MEDGDRVVVVGSQGGLPTEPRWYLNLQEESRVQVQIGAVVHQMEARVADAQERARLWPRMVALYPDFEMYQSWTTRTIPVVVCDPR